VVDPAPSLGPGPQRLFFALWPDAATRARLADWTTSIHDLSGGRAMRPENVHLTLAFLGSTPAAALPSVIAAAGRVAPRRFTLRVDEPGYWRHNRIAWAGVRAVPSELAALVAELRAELAAARVAFDPKPFVAHLTLVRKARPGFAVPPLAPIEWPVRGFALVRSVTATDGSTYQMAQRWG
jgi:RNA 2',3'-cyclic 3'-phosphodiesterase